MADDATADAKAKPAKKSSKLLLFIALGAVLLIGGAVGGAFALGLFGGGEAVAEAETDDDHAPADEKGEPHAAAPAAGKASGADAGDGKDGAGSAGEPVFVDLPQLLVNLVVAEGRPRFLKLSLAVEVDDTSTADRVKQLSPRIIDSFQLYLRTLTPQELQGPGSMFRLKEGLHVRIHQAIEPARVRDVLFKEMLVQ